MGHIKFNENANIEERQKVGHLTLEQEQKAVNAINRMAQLSNEYEHSEDIKAIQDLIYSYENKSHAVTINNIEL